MTPKDLQKRHEEVQIARDARALLDNAVLEDWKGEQKDKILSMLLNAAPGYAGDSDRLHAQARLEALNALAKSLKESVETGMMAEQQIADDKRKRERKHLRQVTND